MCGVLFEGQKRTKKDGKDKKDGKVTVCDESCMFWCCSCVNPALAIVGVVCRREEAVAEGGVTMVLRSLTMVEGCLSEATGAAHSRQPSQTTANHPFYVGDCEAPELKGLDC